MDQPGEVRRVPTPDSAVSGRADGMVPSGPLQGSFSRAFGLNAAVTEPWGEDRRGGGEEEENDFRMNERRPGFASRAGDSL